MYETNVVLGKDCNLHWNFHPIHKYKKYMDVIKLLLLLT